MMQNHFAGTAYDTHRLLEELDLKKEERKKTVKEIILRFSDRQYEMLKSFDTLELKDKLNIMCGVIDFILKQVKNGTDVKQ
jgi:ATP-dependent protease HslVU (ClpYQ) peptidase subunit